MRGTLETTKPRGLSSLNGTHGRPALRSARTSPLPLAHPMPAERLLRARLRALGREFGGEGHLGYHPLSPSHVPTTAPWMARNCSTRQVPRYPPCGGRTRDTEVRRLAQGHTARKAYRAQVPPVDLRSL